MALSVRKVLMNGEQSMKMVGSVQRTHSTPERIQKLVVDWPNE